MAKKPGFSLSLFVRKFVLIIGDEGAVLVHVVRGNVKNAWFVPVDSEEGPEAIREFLLQDKRIPLLVEVDVVEQLYREEQLPKTNPLDHPKVLKRRLDMAFAGEEMKAARPLNRKGPAGQKPYLFMALPMSGWLRKWTGFLGTVTNPVDAFALLPMESLGLVEVLAPPVEVESEKHWRIFVSQEVTGGFRQIIQLNGQFILTRMTPKPAEEDTAEEISQLIEREFKSSIGYIKRLGYQESDHLDLVAVVGAPIRQELFNRDLPVTSLSILTPFEAGQRLGYEKVADPDSPYGDMLHAVWMARKTKAPILLSTAEMKKRRQMRQVEKIVPLAAVLLTAVQLYIVGDALYTNYELGDQIQLRESTLAERNQTFSNLEQEFSNSHFPYDKIKGLLSAQSTLEANQINWPDLLTKLETAIDGKALVLQLNLVADKHIQSAGKTPANTRAKAAAPAESASLSPSYTLELKVVFLEALFELAAIVEQVDDLEKALKDRFPGALIEVKNLPMTVESKASFSSTGKNIDLKNRKMTEVTYVIRQGG